MDADAFARIDGARKNNYPDQGPEEFVRNVLTDARHYCDSNDLDFGAIDREAYSAYYCRENSGAQQERIDMAEEFEENGLSDVAEHLLEHGVAATRLWIDGVIAEAAENDDPEGWRLGNLEVARDYLENAHKEDWRPCDECGEGLVDPSLRRPAEDFVICDNCRDRMEHTKDPGADHPDRPERRS